MSEKKSTWIPGLVSVTFRKLSPEEIITLAKDCGLRAIEWGSDVHAPAGDEERLKQIAALTREAGLQCSSYGTYLEIGSCSAEELRLHIRAAKLLGTRVLRLWAGKKGYAEYTETEKQAFFAECRRLAGIAEEEQVCLCMECHIHSFTDELQGALELMEAVSSDAFRMYWQPNRQKSLDTNREYARRLAGCTQNLHVFGWDGQDSRPLAESRDRWKEYLSYYSGTHFALLEFMPDNDPKSLKAEAQALLGIIRETEE